MVFYCRTLINLADWVLDESLGEVARAIVVDSIGWKDLPAAGRRALARMSADQLEEAIEFAGEMYNENGSAALKALIAQHLPEPTRCRVQDEVLELSRTVGDPARWATLLIRLPGDFPPIARRPSCVRPWTWPGGSKGRMTACRGSRKLPP